MPVKWKIFFTLNFVLSFPALVCLILLIIDLLNSHRRSEDYFITLVFIFGLVMIMLNGFLNIYMIQRFFPDKLLPSPVKRFYILSLVLNSLLAAGTLVLCIYGASIEFSRNNDGRDTSGKIALTIIFVLWLVQIIILIMPGQLPGLISRNNREKMHSLIDSIGQ
jgi:uncharacterized membrane protein